MYNRTCNHNESLINKIKSNVEIAALGRACEMERLGFVQHKHQIPFCQH